MILELELGQIRIQNLYLTIGFRLSQTITQHALVYLTSHCGALS